MYDFSLPGADLSVLKDSRGVQRTKSLFWELSDSDTRKKYPPLYTLKRQTGDLTSAYEVYMASTDETEAALRLVGSLAHWRKLCKLKWFMSGAETLGHEGVESWRDDMRLRDLSLAKQVLMAAAREGDLTAAKKLFDESKRVPITKKATTVKSADDNKILDLHKRITK